MPLITFPWQKKAGINGIHTSIEKKQARNSHSLGEVLVCNLTNHGLLILVFIPFLETAKRLLIPHLEVHGKTYCTGAPYGTRMCAFALEHWLFPFSPSMKYPWWWLGFSWEHQEAAAYSFDIVVLCNFQQTTYNVLRWCIKLSNTFSPVSPHYSTYHWY